MYYTKNLTEDVKVDYDTQKEIIYSQLDALREAKIAIINRLSALNAGLTNESEEGVSMDEYLSYHFDTLLSYAEITMLSCDEINIKIDLLAEKLDKK